MLYSMNPSYANVITPIGVYHTPTHQKINISAAITLYMYTEEKISLLCTLYTLSVCVECCVWFNKEINFSTHKIFCAI